MWWTLDEDGKKLTLGEEPIASVYDMLTRFLAAYQKKLGRKPTPEEFTRTLELALDSRAEDFFGEHVSGVSINLKPQPG